MKAEQFDQAVARITARDSSIHRAAYNFLKDALDVALNTARESKGSSGGHVSAEQLVFAFRDHALKEFGPMAITLLEEWGVTRTADIGSMVFALIDEKMFGRQDSDNEADFVEVFSFDEAFRQPFLPVGKVSQMG